MKRKNFFLFLFIGVYLLVIGTSPMIRASTCSICEISSPRKAISYTAHSPIKIFGNENFKTIAQSEGWPGDGSLSNPYVIAGLQITGSSSDLSLILIEDTDYYFKIANSSLDGKKQSFSGIKLFNVSNGMILDNEVKNCLYSGIYLQFSENITISGNTVSKNGKADNLLSKPAYWHLDQCGVHLILSHTNDITNNTITDNNFNGISLDASSKNFISKNEISDQMVGIGLLGGADYNIISENEIYLNPDTGIFSFDATQPNFPTYDEKENSHNIVTKNTFHSHMGKRDDMGAIHFQGSNNTISYNEFYDNFVCIIIGMWDYGGLLNWIAQNCTIAHNIIYSNSFSILLDNAVHTVIMNNSIFKNGNYGLEIYNLSSQTIVKGNDFLDNNPGGDSQATDDGINNTFSSNYWGNLTTDSYSIAGEAGNVDSSPLASLNRVDLYSQVYYPPTSITSDTSPGWSVIFVLPIIFVYGRIQKKKRK